MAHSCVMVNLQEVVVNQQTKREHRALAYINCTLPVCHRTRKRFLLEFFAVNQPPKGGQVKLTLERKFTNRPAEARRFATAMSCLRGHKATQIVEEIDGDGVVIRTRIETDNEIVLDDIRQIIVAHPDDSQMPLFEQPKAKLTVGDRVRVIAAEDDISHLVGREGHIVAIAEESETPYDVRFDLGYADLANLFSGDQIEWIAAHELAADDVVEDNATYEFHPVELMDGEYPIVNGSRRDPVDLTFIRSGHLVVGDPVEWDPNGIALAEGDEVRVEYPEDFPGDILRCHPLAGRTATIVGFDNAGGVDCALLKADDGTEDACGVEYCKPTLHRGFISSFERDPETGATLVNVELRGAMPLDDVRLNLTAVKVLVEAQRKLIELAEAAQQEPYEQEEETVDGVTVNIKSVKAEVVPVTELEDGTVVRGESIGTLEASKATGNNLPYGGFVTHTEDLPSQLEAARKLRKKHGRMNHELIRKELGVPEGRAIAIAKALETEGVPA